MNAAISEAAQSRYCDSDSPGAGRVRIRSRARLRLGSAEHHAGEPMLELAAQERKPDQYQAERSKPKGLVERVDDAVGFQEQKFQAGPDHKKGDHRRKKHIRQETDECVEHRRSGSPAAGRTSRSGIPA